VTVSPENKAPLFSDFSTELKDNQSNEFASPPSLHFSFFDRGGFLFFFHPFLYGHPLSLLQSSFSPGLAGAAPLLKPIANCGLLSSDFSPPFDVIALSYSFADCMTLSFSPEVKD